MLKLFLIGRARANFLPALVTASCLSAVPANAAAVSADFGGGKLLQPIVVSIESHTEIVVSILGSPGQVLKVAPRPFAIVESDLKHDGVLDLSALFPPRKLRAWLSYGHGGFGQLHSRLRSPFGSPSHAQAASRLRRPRTHGSPLQHAFRFGADRPTRGNAPTTQAASSGAVGLHNPPPGPASPASRFAVLPSSERIPFNERTGRRASRAPPLFTI
jgi:hypothetical protein